MLPILSKPLIPSKIANQVDKFVQKNMAEFHIPGLSVAVLHDGKVVFSKGFGLADMKTGRKVTNSTTFWIGSLTKQFTAALIMKEVESGAISIREPLAKAWPESPKEWKKITIFQLLTHTSGIPNFTMQPDFLEKMNSKWDWANEFKKLGKTSLDFAPGEKYEYSNTNYTVLGCLLESLTKKSYHQLVKEEIAVPYDLNSLGPIQTPDENPETAVGYMPMAAHNQDSAPPIDPSYALAAGDLEMTPTDLLKWIVALQTQFLSKKSLQQLYVPAKVREGGSDYGLGWVIGDYRGLKTIGHDGEINGFTTSLIRFPTVGYAVAVFANINGLEIDPITLGIARLVMGIADFHPIKDSQPKVTKRIVKALSDAIRGQIDEKLISPDLAKLIEEQTKNGLPISSESLQKMDLVKVDSDKRTRTYIIHFKGQTIILTCNLDEEGILTSVMLRPY